MPLLILRNFVLNILLSHKFFVPLQAKSKTYGMRCTTVHMTPLGSVNVADHIAAIGTKASEGGLPIQYYAPYGELIANQQTIGYDERYKFTGKERDWETGYDYFGARFYDHRKGFWNSIDPLADKYPNVTPYLYCNGNPVMLVDPDERIIEFAPGCSEEFKAAFIATIQQLNDAGVGCIFEELAASHITYYIADASNRPANQGSGFNSNTQTISWKPSKYLYTEEGNTLSPATILNHESAHALLYDEACKNGTLEQYKENKVKGTDEQYDSINERIVITVYEQETAEALGEVQYGIPTRNNHNGTEVVNILELTIIPE